VKVTLSPAQNHHRALLNRAAVNKVISMLRDYFLWSLEQFYLMFFWPSKFRNTVEGVEQQGQRKLSYRQRFRYLLKLFPWTLLFSLICNLILGFLCEASGVPYLWLPSWGGVLFGLICGTVLGVVIGVATGFAASISSSGVLGISAGVGIGTSLNNWAFFIIGVLGGLGAVVLFGLAVRNKRFLVDRESVVPVIVLALTIAALASTGLAIAIFAPTASSHVPVDVSKGRAISVGVAAVSGVMTGLSCGAILGLTRGLLFGFAFGISMSVAGALAFGLPGGMIYGAELGKAVGVGFLLGFSVPLWLTYFRVVMYPIDLAFSVFSYLKGQQPNGALNAWRWCPVAWNEVIWLPLPFVSKLLLLCVKEDRKRGFDLLTFIGAERPLQRRVVRATLNDIAVNSLEVDSLPDIADVTKRLDWTSNSRTELPPILMASIARFERISRQAEQYLSSLNEYQKRISLGQAIEELESLQLSLIGSDGDIPTQLLLVANRWHGVLQAERVRLHAQIQISDEIPNPFVFGRPIDQTEQNIFMGRQDIARLIEASILGAAQTPTLLLQGARRMGKTSILKQLPRLLGPNFAPIILDCQDSAARGSVTSFLYHLSLAITEGVQQRRLNIKELQREKMDNEPFEVFDDWLRKLEREMPKDMRLLLCLDEYEALQPQTEKSWECDLLDTLRHWIQFRPRIVLMFSGARTFPEMGAVWTGRFINARRVRVSFLKPEDVITLLTKPIPDFNMTYTPEALNKLITATNCQPFLTQAVAFELVQLMNDSKRKEAGVSDVNAAVSFAFESADAYLSNVWSDAGEQGRMILRAIANGDDPPYIPDSLAWLRNHDVINQEGCFAVPMVEQWVREYKSN
jgi:uncharacterized protein